MSRTHVVVAGLLLWSAMTPGTCDPGDIIDIIADGGGGGPVSYRVEGSIVDGVSSDPYELDGRFLQQVTAIALVNSEAQAVHYLELGETLVVTHSNGNSYEIRRGGLDDSLKWACIAGGNPIELHAGKDGVVPPCLRAPKGGSVSDLRIGAFSGDIVIIATADTSLNPNPLPGPGPDCP